MSRKRLKTVTFEGSSNKLRAKAMKRIGVTHTVMPTFFAMVIVNTRYSI